MIDENNSTDELIIFLDEDIIPNYELFYNSLISISPIDEQISKAHSFYIEASKYQLSAFQVYLEGLKESDFDKISTVNTLIEQSKEYLILHKNELLNIINNNQLKIIIE